MDKNASKKVCGNCKFFQSGQEPAGPGACSASGVWEVTPFVVPNLCACEAHRLSWEPVPAPASAQKQPAPARNAQPTDWLGLAQKFSLAGLLLTPVVLVADLFLGIPILPDLTLIWVVFWGVPFASILAFRRFVPAK